ncbi:MAG: CNP1-like family protein [Chloroflexi bacterium]|nr:CNP1-like family protein [Chloroflexota bacterium]
MKPFIRCLVLGLMFGLGGLVHADSGEADEAKVWQEAEISLPAPPRNEGLLAFEVSAATGNRFSIDPASLSVGLDGVVRYTLVVLAPAGGRSITYEGIRCETRERRIYASGRSDGTWSKSRANQWSRIQEAYANRQHAALYLDYFCPGGLIVNDADEARAALRQGGHPANKRW